MHTKACMTILHCTQVRMYTGDSSPDDKCSFVTERQCFLDLLTGLASPCSCGVTGNPWLSDSVTQKGHVLRVQFACRRCCQPRTWASSRVLASHYVVNQRYIHRCASKSPSFRRGPWSKDRHNCNTERGRISSKHLFTVATASGASRYCWRTTLYWRLGECIQSRKFCKLLPTRVTYSRTHGNICFVAHPFLRLDEDSSSLNSNCVLEDLMGCNKSQPCLAKRLFHTDYSW